MTEVHEPIPQEVWDELEEEETPEGALADVEVAETTEKKAKTPPHVRRFYERLGDRLDEKGVWGPSQTAKSLKALMLREQNVTGKQRPEPFGRLDRKRLVDRLVKEGKLTKQPPRNVRETAGVIHPATVDALLPNLPDEAKSSPEALTATIARLFGIRSGEVLARRTLRAKRWMLNNPGRRVPMHVREGAILSTAIAVAVTALFPDQQTEETREGVQLLREQYGTPLPEAA